MRTLRFTLAVALTFTLAACGGSEPTALEDGIQNPSLAIVSGNEQEVEVTDTLPFDAVVQVLDGGQPVPSQLVDWRVLEDNAGEPFVTTTRTDADGLTGNRVVAGTRAHTHPDIDGFAHMEVRWIDQDSSSVEARVDTTIRYLVLPGELDAIRLGDADIVDGGDTVDVRTFLRDAADQYGNPIPMDSVTALDGSQVSWRWSDRAGGSDATGPEGAGWTLVADTTAFSERGYAVRTRNGLCPVDGEQVETTTTFYMAELHVEVQGVEGEIGGFEVVVENECKDMQG